MRFYATGVVTPAANPTTIFQVLGPTNGKILILALDLSLRGTTPATTPVPFDWAIQTTTGSGSTVIVPIKQDRGWDEDIGSKYELRKGFENEPTTGSTIISFSLHQQSTMPWRPPFPIVAKTAERVGLIYKSGTYVEVVYTVYMDG